jgi:small subunit ribosomal protein S8
MMTDPISDMLARIRNAGNARHTKAVCPSSKARLAVARVLQKSGFLGDVQVEARDGHPVMVLGIRYDANGWALIDGMRRVSKPSRRVYVAKGAVPRVRQGLGVAVLSTSRGIISDAEAREQGVGGEVMCEVW